ARTQERAPGSRVDSSGSGRHKVTIYEAGGPDHDRAPLVPHRLTETRPRVYERVKLAVLPAGIHVLWKVVQQVDIEFPAGELAPELRPVHAHDDGPVPLPAQFL